MKLTINHSLNCLSAKNSANIQGLADALAVCYTLLIMQHQMLENAGKKGTASSGSNCGPSLNNGALSEPGFESAHHMWEETKPGVYRLTFILPTLSSKYNRLLAMLWRWQLLNLQCVEAFMLEKPCRSAQPVFHLQGLAREKLQARLACQIISLIKGTATF